MGDPVVVITDASGPNERRDRFESFVAANGDRLLRAAYGMCGDWQHAEDLVQVVLCKLADHWDDIATNPLGYAYRCLTRARVDRWRRLRRRAELLVEPAALSEWEAAPEGSDAADDHLVILAALRTLPRQQRAIIVLRYLEDLSEQETAALLGISTGAVKSGASRGLARLRAARRSEFEELE